MIPCSNQQNEFSLFKELLKALIVNQIEKEHQFYILNVLMYFLPLHIGHIKDNYKILVLFKNLKIIIM
jgi:hypothetical protein